MNRVLFRPEVPECEDRTAVVAGEGEKVHEFTLRFPGFRGFEAEKDRGGACRLHVSPSQIGGRIMMFLFRG
jgi:hypothetical protein